VRIDSAAALGDAAGFAAQALAEYRNSEIATTRLGKWLPDRIPYMWKGSLIATSGRRLNTNLKQKPAHARP
jgi:hypothetical protein